MIVRCVRLINEVTGEFEESSPWATVGKTYVVLAISMTPDQPVRFRLIGDDAGTPVLFDSRMFELVSDEIPSSWRVDLVADGFVEMAPSSWLRQGFWDDYFDVDPAARREFEAEATAMLSAGM